MVARRASAAHPQDVALHARDRASSSRRATSTSNVIGGTLLHEGENELLHTRSAYIAVGRDDVVEIAEPLDAGTPIADYVDANHHGLFAVWLQVEDLAGATGYLPSKEIAPSLEDGAPASSPIPRPPTACTGASPPRRSPATPAPTGSGQ